MNYQLYHGDCLDIMPTLESGSVNLIACDLPYFGVKDDAWDNQWQSRDDFLAWVGRVCDEWQRLLAPNGSVYAFASPQMAWHVEGVIRQRFNVLNQIIWAKPEPTSEINYGAGNGGRVSKEILRRYYPNTEMIIFAEHGNSDQVADEIAGFTEAETKLKREIFGAYLLTEFARAGVKQKQIAMLFPSATGNPTGCVSNWLLGYNVPTPEQYQAMRDYLNSVNGHSDYLSRQYEDLRRQYEDLRRQYEELRRPFNATPDAPYTDVWTFPTVNTYPGKHPTEKPISLMQHIVNLSSRPGDVVLDCCMGYGTTGVAAGQLGRKFVGIEMDGGYFAEASARIAAAYGDWDKARKVRKGKATDTADLPLFA